MKQSLLICCFLLLTITTLMAQQHIAIEATLDTEDDTFAISQEVDFQNTSETALSEIYFNDWPNSFSTKTSELAKRFAENFSSSFHFEKEEDRGRTDLFSIATNGIPLEWKREAADIIKVSLKNPLPPGETVNISLLYKVKVPDAKFTRYGVTSQKDYRLRYWYISPAVYDGKWHAYSNKNVDDLYLSPSDFTIQLTLPSSYNVASPFREVSNTTENGTRTVTLEAMQRSQAPLVLERQSTFETIETDKVDVLTNIIDPNVPDPMRALFIDRIIYFLDDKLGAYPFEKIMATETDYRNNPVYGLNQLPDFISPFPDGFEYEMEQLKTITREYLESSLPLHPREEYWLTGALQIYMMMEYVDTYYPKMKIIGKLSDFWVIRWAHAADLEFNDQYPVLYLNMARNNLQQSLTTPKDSLIKFNKEIANDYYGGAGLRYLKDYLGQEPLENTIRSFYERNRLNKEVTPSDFQSLLMENTSLPVDWFFSDYIDSRTTIDFKITKVEEVGDSLRVTVKNKRKSAMPVSLYGLNNDEVLFKKWLPPIDKTAEITVAADSVRKLALNYEAKIPEYNQRNNYKAVKGLLNRPLQFRLFQDVEDPKYNQVFIMPVFKYNLYDGFIVGPQLYNKTVLPKGIHYKLSPQIGLRSGTIVGSGSIAYTQNIDNNSDLYAMRYGFGGSYFSYDRGLFYKRFTPYITFAFRNDDLRDNEKQFINLRSVNVFRDENPLDRQQDPNYSVFNFQYVYSNPNLINYFRGVVDYQISSKFSKLSAELEYRKLFLSNRQLNIRFFAGAFLFNDTREEDDFFSFALDRPTDYLFDHNYYGRSEASGLFSQQLILAEGGFKSQLQPQYANSWITTVNVSTNIWKWIYAYADAGLVHNTDRGTQGVFDTGVRASLVADYFELYFPLYSNLGWEPGLDNYDQRIRFIVTLELKTLLGLFTRKWY
ncbi:gluzincin family metallopeptidase [Luteirhabdus pelagi]|uniref:metalloprotease n=1 Tax=Luteirhabdus pelagi TaxID=2792783 RepID=UPI001F41D59D|nr:metalloprotease [Luteirhabdus pelagi]